MVVEKSDLLRSALERQQAETNALLRKLARRTDNIVGIDNLRTRLDCGEKIVEYQGYDPTKPDLHVGHLVSLLVHRDFQQDGHTVIFLLGGFTAMVGDPSGKTSARAALTLDQVRANSQTYRDQVGKILDFEHPENPVQLKNNYDWLSQVSLLKWLEVCQHFTLSYLRARDMFQVMEEKEEPIHMHVLQYPLLQGYDSVHMGVDLEVGGSDQYFNMMVGRDLVYAIQDREKFVLTTPLLPSATKEKMGKTEGGAINLTLGATELFIALMRIADKRIIDYSVLLTDVELEELARLENQFQLGAHFVMEAKEMLAFQVVKTYYGEAAAVAAQRDYTSVRSGEQPEAITEVTLEIEAPLKLYQVLVQSGLAINRNAAKTLITNGSVIIDGSVCTDSERLFSASELNRKVFRVGKKGFTRLLVSNI